MAFKILVIFGVFIASNFVHGEYRLIPLGGLKQVSTSVNYIWGVNTQYQIFKCDRPCSGKWQRNGGALMQVDVGDDEVWGVDRRHYIYKKPADGSGGWRRIGGRLKQVSASGNGYIWGVNSGCQIFKCKKPCNGRWIHVPGKLSQIDGGHDYVYGINRAGHIFTRPVDGSKSWRHIPGLRLKYITGSGGTDVFGVDRANNVYRCKKPCVGDFERMEGNLMQCDATFDSFIGVNSGHSVLEKVTGI